MNAIAKEILAANKAGLLLCGVEEGRPLWLGAQNQFSEYGRLITFHEANGRFPELI